MEAIALDYQGYKASIYALLIIQFNYDERNNKNVKSRVQRLL